MHFAYHDSKHIRFLYLFRYRTNIYTHKPPFYLNSDFKSNYSFIWNWINFSNPIELGKCIQLEISLDLNFEQMNRVNKR